MTTCGLLITSIPGCIIVDVFVVYTHAGAVSCFCGFPPQKFSREVDSLRLDMAAC